MFNSNFWKLLDMLLKGYPIVITHREHGGGNGGAGRENPCACGTVPWKIILKKILKVWKKNPLLRVWICCSKVCLLLSNSNPRACVALAVFWGLKWRNSFLSSDRIGFCTESWESRLGKHGHLSLIPRKGRTAGKGAWFILVLFHGNWKGWPWLCYTQCLVGKDMLF